MQAADLCMNDCVAISSALSFLCALNVILCYKLLESWILDFAHEVIFIFIELYFTALYFSVWPILYHIPMNLLYSLLLNMYIIMQNYLYDYNIYDISIV